MPFTFGNSKPPTFTVLLSLFKCAQLVIVPPMAPRLNCAFENVTLPVLAMSSTVSVSVTSPLPGVSVGTLRPMRVGTLRTWDSSASMTPLPLMSIFGALTGLAPELPKLTITSARTAAPTGRFNTSLSKDAENNRLLDAPGAMVTSGTSAKALLLLASMNNSRPKALFSLKLDLFSELALATTLALVAASSFVASAMSED